MLCYCCKHLHLRKSAPTVHVAGEKGYMSHDARKSGYAVSDQERCGPAWVLTQSNELLCCSFPAKNDI